ncbi:MAG TPA: HRDC domain-containing protein [Candidatus Polarisedimenticolaceae bacterium]|nr:HRDC domain-containing protein [Candidatus Polarisedimenticolaceae bacterium]
MAGSYVWCTRTEDLAREIGRIGSGPIALDSESDSLHHYPEKICLVQLSSAGRDLLIDPLAGVDLEPLGPLLAERRIRKVLHGADYDLRVIDRDLGLRVAGLFDTMVAARLCGERQFGLAALLDRYLGVQLDKRFQRADWSRRPLPAAMIRYAVLDTRHLVELSSRLESRLQALGRITWAEEEFGVLERIRFSEPDDREAYRAVRGSATLDRRGLAVLRELHVLRERLARAADRPPFRIAHNELLLRIARERPRSRERIAQLLDRRESAGASGAAARWSEAVERALSLGEEELPAPTALDVGRRVARKSARLKWLVERRNGVAVELGLDPSLVGPRAVVEAALERADRGENPQDTPGLRRWQWALIGEAILDAAE